MRESDGAGAPVRWSRAAAAGLTFRPIADADLAFLARLYASTRMEELSVTDWSDERKTAFLQMQFDAQHAHYQQHYAGTDFLVIARAAEAVGRLYLARWSSEHRIVDIAFLPEHRGKGGNGQWMGRGQQGRHPYADHPAGDCHAGATRPAPPQTETPVVIAEKATARGTGRHNPSYIASRSASASPCARRVTPSASARCVVNRAMGVGSRCVQLLSPDLPGSHQRGPNCSSRSRPSDGDNDCGQKRARGHP